MCDDPGFDQPPTLKPLENVIGFTLADIPDIAQFLQKPLVQFIAVARPGGQKAKQGKFRRMTGCATVYTHSMSISNAFRFNKMIFVTLRR